MRSSIDSKAERYEGAELGGKTRRDPIISENSTNFCPSEPDRIKTTVEIKTKVSSSRVKHALIWSETRSWSVELSARLEQQRMDGVSRTWAEGTPSHPFPRKIRRLDLTLHSPLIKVNTVYSLLRTNEIQAGVMFSISLAELAPK